MTNPYPANFETLFDEKVRLNGEITFTDPANQPGGGGGGSVNSVTAGDASITVAGTATDPTVAVSALGVTSAKIAATAVTQAKLALASVDQAQMASVGRAANWVPLADGSGGVAWGVSPGVNSVAAADTSVVVGGTAQAPTVRTNTVDVIATQHPPAADWSNNSHKITSLANGSGAQDAAAFGQIPTALPPNGSAGGDLSGTYPNPTVVAVQGVAVSGTAPSATYVLTASDATHAAWAAASSGFTNPMTTKGDIIIENATPAPDRLAVGSTGQTLGVASGVPAWSFAPTLIVYGLYTTGNRTTAGTTFAGGQDLLASALTFTADGASDYYICVFADSLRNDTINDGARININFDGADQGQFISAYDFAASTQSSGCTAFGVIPAATATAGSHTVNARLIAVAGGTASVEGGPGGANQFCPILVGVGRL